MEVNLFVGSATVADLGEPSGVQERSFKHAEGGIKKNRNRLSSQKEVRFSWE